MIPLPAENCNDDSSRYVPINDSFDSDGKSPKSSSYSLARDLVREKILYLFHATAALRYHFVVVGMFFLWKPCVTKYN